MLLVKSDNKDTEKLEKNRADYAAFSRPGMAEKLRSMRLDTVFSEAYGNYLIHQVDGRDIKVLDALGGFGANIFGHHHPQLVDVLRENLDAHVPYMAQMSVRPNAAILGSRLNDFLSARSDDQWVSLILTTGADAVEAALKHSEMYRVKRLETYLAKLQKQFVRCQQGLLDGKLQLNNEYEDQARAILGVHAPAFLELEFSEFLVNRMTEVASTQPLSLALERGYHGKSNGALHLTAAEKYRRYFSGIAHSTDFVNPLDDQSLIEKISQATIWFPYLTVIDEQVHLIRKPFVNITSLFVEPLQGEGGVRPISKRFLQQCRELSLQHDFLFVMDEIQSGMGRTGTFLYSEQLGVSADCYLLSKSLGGGVCKISAACFAQRIYDPEFDEIHSSTFAEDDHSAAVAVQALAMIQDQPELMNTAHERGENLKKGLERVQKCYPGIVADVRGQGLLIGIEFSSQIDSEFFVLRALSQHKLLGYVIVANLLHEHRVRVATTMSDNFVLRIEPSFYISEQECESIVSAIEKVVEILHHGNMYRLIRFMVGLEGFANRALSEKVESFIGRGNGKLNSPQPDCPTVTFASNIIKPMHLIQLEPSLSPFSETQLQRLCEEVLPAIGPTTVLLETLTSDTGEQVNFKIEMIMYDPGYLSQAMFERNLGQVDHDLNIVMNGAIEQDNAVLGLGAYTSIVSRNGLKLVSNDICITTGNALTVGIGVRTMLQAANKLQVDVSNATLGVVGAGGNIGSIYAQVLADHVENLVLVGRPGRLQKLDRVAADIYSGVVLNPDIEHVDEGVSNSIKATKVYQRRDQFDLSTPFGRSELYRAINQEMGRKAPIKVVGDMSELTECNLILCASNSPDAILLAKHIGEQPTVVCDVSVPEDVAQEVHQLQNALVISGGIVELPRDPKLRWLGIDNLGQGAAYACMAETALLGLDGRRNHGSYGPISKQQVSEMLELADKHGFKLAQAKTGESVF